MKTRFSVACAAGLLLAACTSDPDEKPSVDSGRSDMGVSADMAQADVASDGYCPVVGYSPCGGDLVGTWEFRSLCPEDAAAAAALCEHPYGDRAACTGAGNEAVCDGTYVGTLTFNADLSASIEAVNTLVGTYSFTDDCLAEVARSGTPEERCASLGTDRLMCTYDGSCSCVGDPIVQDDANTFEYAFTAENEVTLGDDPPSTYCVDGDRLIMDYEVFHPVSWRYWVLERQ